MPDKVYRTAIYCRLSREDGDKVGTEWHILSISSFDAKTLF
jgi:hypothetical protein